MRAIVSVAFAGLFVLTAVSGFAGTDARKQVLDRVQTLETKGQMPSDVARRIRWHVLENDNLVAEAKKNVAAFDSDRKQDIQLDIRVKILKGEITGNDLRSHLFPYRNNPSILTLVGTAFPESIRIEANPWFGAYGNDVNWVPAIFGLIQTSHPGRITGARYASQGLDLLEPGSREAVKMMPQIASVFGVSSQTPEEIARGILVQLDEREWPQISLVLKERLEAALLMHSGQTQEALERYLTIIKGDGKSDSTYYRIAEIYASQGQSDKAENILREGLEAFPRSSVLLTRHADDLFRGGNPKAAKEQVGKCLESSPEYPPAHLLLARILAATGEHEQAAKSCLDTLRFSHGWGTDYVALVDEVLRIIRDTPSVVANGSEAWGRAGK